MNNTNPTALILLSTYNGEKYLDAQINSLISQSFTDWILLIRDDGSSDATVQIINQFCLTDHRIILLQDTLGNLRIQKSFSALMQRASERHEDFIFFCDQDDVWLPDKLSIQVSLLNELQEKHGVDTPLLIHSDLCVVDRDLKVIHPSYLAFEKLTRNPEFPLKTLLINNYITGCTVGINRALLNVANPIPDNAYMHDWWCALCAAATGVIGFVDEATILYRQHGGNSIGSKGFYGKFKELTSLNNSIIKRINNLRACFNQGKSLLSRLNQHHRYDQLINNFVGLGNKRKFSRYFFAAKLQLQPASKIRTIVFWFFLGFV